MDKITQLRKELSARKLDSLFVSGQENVTYLTRVSGLNTGEREAFLLITKNEAFLFAFATTFQMYKKVSGFETFELTVNFRLHQVINKIIKDLKLHNIGFEGNNMTYSEVSSLQKNLSKKLIPTDGIIENLRQIKTIEEINQIKKAAGITDEAFLYILKEINAGITEKELAVKIEFFIRKKTQNIAFSPIVAFNLNASIPHYLPSDKEKLAKNGLILIDIGAKYNNYCSDLSRVVFFGSPGNSNLKIYNCVLEAQVKAISSVKIGKSGEDIDKISRDYIIKNKFPAYNHGLGHGVGLAIHELPRLRPGIKQKLIENMVFTIEPGIYIPGLTGVRIEDLLVLRKDGPEILSKSPKELIIL